ncbi:MULTISPECIES: LacI family DNA-binding transcriptional regulator [Pontibacillus]|uniref:LacI family DNA-binding transcriptional regulator n=1 Tax=Pontibacillus chungwhensis TaxID=265426 RepID=A0ABY8V497_9BACI|nr:MULTISPECIES: LacI family DNA-binding transcriptional regulator [Pontibacillus]MCD5322132.1 LacI family transcriptional regulator [Pontibacillus sp. HN14]WIF99430.1 LacI family DNA-binding transcriptional regulator [Pontibacillus chungwhensis]
MVTIDDVAKRAGLSKSTVSRVINDYPHVSIKKKEKVFEAMKELGYVPNSSARSLRNKKTKMIAVLVPRIMNPFFGQLAESMEIQAAKHGYQLLICQTMYSTETELKHLELLKMRQVDGMILTSLENDWDVVKEYLSYGPMILCNEFEEEATIPTVKFDQVHGGYVATKHLIRQGHKKIAYCTGGQKSNVGQHRRRGFDLAFEEFNLNFDERYGFYDAFSIEDGIRIFKHIHQMPDPPTAVFTGSDEVAAGIITGAKEYGVKVPESLAVIGFDNQVITKVMDPKISTVEQPIPFLAKRAVEVMLDRIHHKGKEKEVYEYPLELIIRESTVSPIRAVE